MHWNGEPPRLEKVLDAVNGRRALLTSVVALSLSQDFTAPPNPPLPVAYQRWCAIFAGADSTHKAGGIRSTTTTPQHYYYTTTTAPAVTAALLTALAAVLGTVHDTVAPSSVHASLENHCVTIMNACAYRAERSRRGPSVTGAHPLIYEIIR
ncbi:hypothetical protein B5X24_HaOG213336 [Helicoverpa armigera]|nr:hypothetical protein B5X24_HaOG213336 [Helicoverpa armigera]